MIVNEERGVATADRWAVRSAIYFLNTACENNSKRRKGNMTTETKETPVMVEVEFNNQKVEIEKDGRLHKQIQNLIEEQRAEEFSDQRAMFLEAALKVILEQMNGFEDVLDGQALVYNFAEDGPTLHRAELIKIGKRVGKKSD